MSRSRVRFPSRALLQLWFASHGADVEAVVDVSERFEELGGALVQHRETLELGTITVGSRLRRHAPILVGQLAFERGEVTFTIATRRHDASATP